MYFDKKNCLNRAKDLFSQNDDVLLRYICLELRYCIESIVYETVKIYADQKRLSPSVIQTWQPAKLMKSVCIEEPLADEDYEFFVFPESSPRVPSGNGIHLGVQKKLKYRWLAKNYNKLGSYLHTPSINQSNKQGNEKIKNFLKKTIGHLTEVIEDTTLISTGLSEITHFECQECKQPILINSEGIKKMEYVECRNENCRAIYHIENNNGTYCLQIKRMQVKCDKCGNTFSIKNHKAKVGVEYKCSQCDSEYKFVSEAYALLYKKIPNLNDNG